MQDILSLGNEARMNTPGVADGNWTWRIGSPQFFSSLVPEASKLAQMVSLYDRAQEIGDNLQKEKVDI
jgi:4-alpha-glucanotransferase